MHEGDEPKAPTTATQPAAPTIEEHETTIRLAIVHGSKVLTTLFWVVLIGYGLSLLAAAFTPWWVSLLSSLVGPTSIGALIGGRFWKYRQWSRQRMRELEATVQDQALTIQSLDASWFGGDEKRRPKN